MIGGLGVTELIIILVILLLIFGPSRLGDLGTSLGKGIKGFRKAVKETDEIDVTPKRDDKNSLKSSPFKSAQKNSSKKDEVI